MFEFNVTRRWPALARVLAAAACLAVLAGCSGESVLVDDRNPFYVKGLRLRQENRYTDAAEAFEKCLRLSPASAKAHVQLAMLYEDRLNDPVRAIDHYRAYLAKSPNGENADMVRKWLVRAERSFLQKLMRQYPDDVEVLTNNGAPPGVPVGVTPREIQLGRRLKEVSLQLNQAREDLRRVTGGADAGRGAGTTVGQPSASRPPADQAPRDNAGPTRPESGPADFSPGTPGPAAGGEPVLPVGDGPPIEAAAGERPPAPVAAVPEKIAPKPVATLPSASQAAPARATVSPSAPGTPVAGPAGAGTPAAGRPFKPLWRLTPGGRVAPPAASSGSASGGGRGGAVVRHTVQAGETLSGLARQYYGRAGAWTRIRDANPELRAGGALRPGRQVVIP